MLQELKLDYSNFMNTEETALFWLWQKISFRATKWVHLKTSSWQSSLQKEMHRDMFCKGNAYCSFEKYCGDWNLGTASNSKDSRGEHSIGVSLSSSLKNLKLECGISWGQLMAMFYYEQHSSIEGHQHGSSEESCKARTQLRWLHRDILWHLRRVASERSCSSIYFAENEHYVQISSR